MSLSSIHRRGWLLSLLLLLPLAVAHEVRADEVTDWHEHTLSALISANVNPVVSTRDAALVSAAVFDAVNGIERRYEPIFVPAAAPRGASKRAAAVQAAYTILLARLPAQAADLGTKRNASLAAIGDADGLSVQRGIEWGKTVANAILAWRSTDGFTPPPAAYVGGNEPGRWRPTPTGFATGAAPQFATMTPWGIDSPDQFRPLGPPALDSLEYLVDYEEVKQMGSASSPLRTADETEACFFWNTSTATWLWNRVALDLVEGEDVGLSDNARLFARLNLAIADGLIACWDAKYYYEFWRPITAIQLEDLEWTPLFATPPHPEYVSGHSSLSSAAAGVLVEYFGDDTPFLLESQVDPDWLRFYPSFSAALDELADARVFAGIHFRTACDDGLVLGGAVAGHILDNLMGRIHGEGE
jgi:hypothetical protein